MQNVDNWRESANHMLRQIGKATDYSKARKESYEELERRGGANLKQRLINAKARLQEQGASRTKVEQLNYMDVIEQDKRLKEIYLNIVKEMHIRYCG